MQFLVCFSAEDARGHLTPHIVPMEYDCASTLAAHFMQAAERAFLRHEPTFPFLGETFDPQWFYYAVTREFGRRYTVPGLLWRDGCAYVSDPPDIVCDEAALADQYFPW